MIKHGVVDIELNGLAQQATVKELIEALDAFKNIYSAALQAYPNSDLSNNVDEIRQAVERHIGQCEEEVENPLMFSSISMNSPLNMKFHGVRVGLVAILILCGVEIEVRDINSQLADIGSVEIHIDSLLTVINSFDKEQNLGNGGMEP